MPLYKESFFRIFQSKIGEPLRRFFENRHGRMTDQIALESIEPAALERLMALELIEYDRDAGEYRLDDRVERFFDEMLGAIEAAHADWLVSLTGELRRLIEGYYKLADANKGETLLGRIRRLLGNCLSRMERHLDEVKSAVDYDYRAGADYEIKLLKLQWHLDRTRSYGLAVAELDRLLRTNTFFQIHQGMELLSLRGRIIRRCGRVGDALVDVYQRIEEYLNRTLRDYARVQKLIRLRGLIERHEHLTGTNLEEVTSTAKGPWFHAFSLRTLIDPALIDRYPELLERVLARAGITEPKTNVRRVEITQDPEEVLPPVIDWKDLYEAFSVQTEDLFVFLETVRVEGRLLTEEERIDGYCAILANEDWMEGRDESFVMAAGGNWEYAEIWPPESLPQ